jgi:hypothetical protein
VPLTLIGDLSIQSRKKQQGFCFYDVDFGGSAFQEKILKIVNFTLGFSVHGKNCTYPYQNKVEGETCHTRHGVC